MRAVFKYTNSGYYVIPFILLISCKGYNIVISDSLNIKAKKSIEEYNFNEINLSNYRDSISFEMNEIINYSDVNMNVGCPEGLLGNFITDITFTYTSGGVATTITSADFNTATARVRIEYSGTPDFSVSNLTTQLTDLAFRTDDEAGMSFKMGYNFGLVRDMKT